MLFKRFFGPVDPQFLNAFAKAGVLGLHLVSGVLVGGSLGYGLDYWLGTFPWLSLSFLLLGIISGFWSVYLDSKELIASQNKKK